jgi:hypothetical protein
VLALLLAFSGPSLFAAFAAAGFDARRAFLHATVAWGLLTVAFTEGLSLFSAIGQVSLASAWAVVVVAALWIAWCGRAAVIQLVPARSDLRWEIPGAFVMALPLLSGVALSAVFAPPNTMDVIAYHLPRILFWEQAGDLGFFPTNYYQQLSLPPFHEFVMLHIHLLGGSDRFVQLGSLAAFAGCIVGVSIVAKSFGCGLRGQLAAAFFCLTLPNAILQGSSAKNDLMTAFWIIIAVGFATRRWDRFTREQAYGMSAASALALLTKGTAYIYLPPILIAIYLGQTATARRALLRRLPSTLLVLILLVNGGYYLRNWNHNGHPLGDGSSDGGGHFRYANDRLEAGTTVSNVLRNATLQFVAWPAWNASLYEAVLAVHGAMGWDPNDPATTWFATNYEASKPGNHEATSANPFHLLLLIVVAGSFILGRRWGRPGWYGAGIVLAAILFCFYLRWQPWHARLHLPLFIAAAPLFGVAAEHLRSKALMLAVLAWLAWSARAPLLDNDLRPLRGPQNVLRAERAAQYFPSRPRNGQRHHRLAKAIAVTNCRDVGVDARYDSSEYPVMGLLLDEDPAFRIRHLGVHNPTARYDLKAEAPCAVVCLRCAEKTIPYVSDPAYASAIEVGKHLLFLSRGLPGQGGAP